MSHSCVSNFYMNDSTTHSDPLDDLHSIAAQISMAIELHQSLSATLDLKVIECFEAGADIPHIARNSNLAEATITMRHGHWLESQPVEASA